MVDHIHRWRQAFEEALWGGYFPIGWECVDCGKFVPQHKMRPDCLGGIIVGGASLIAPHGGRGITSTGKPYTRQIVDADGRLTII